MLVIMSHTVCNLNFIAVAIEELHTRRRDARTVYRGRGFQAVL